MPTPTFYVGAVDQTKNVVSYVPATFVTINGVPVVDPVVGGSQVNRIYGDSLGATLLLAQ